MPASTVNPLVRGWLKDPVDHNKQDKRFRLCRAALQDMGSTGDEFHIPEFTPISDQSYIGSCVANAGVDMLEMLRGLDLLRQAPDETPTVEQLSRLFLYWISRCVTGDQKLDKGTYIRNAMSQCMTVGVAPEKFWEYDIGQVFTSPPLWVFNAASDNKINGLFRIDSYGDERSDDVETAVRANHPVVFGTAVGVEYQQYRGGGNAFEAPNHSIGGHAQIIVGVRRRLDGKREFLVRNSWSEEWGDAGHAWISEQYLEDPRTDDLWLGTTMKELIL